MLRYCHLPTKRMPLESLGRSPLLWCHQGKHAPFIDAINGVLDAAGVRLDAEDAFLQRVAAGKKGAKRFTVTSFVFRLPFLVCDQVCEVSCSGKSSAEGYPKTKVRQRTCSQRIQKIIHYLEKLVCRFPVSCDATQPHVLPSTSSCGLLCRSWSVQASDPLLMPKLFSYARQRGNTPLLNYLFRKMCHGGRESRSLLPA